MTIPQSKKIKATSAVALAAALRDQNLPREVMIVTHAKSAHKDHISTAQVQDVAEQNGWKTGRRYTLTGDLTGHVVSKI